MRCRRCFSMHQQDGQPSSVYTVHVHPQRSLLATGGADNHVKLWDLREVLPLAHKTKLPNIVNDDAILPCHCIPRLPLVALPRGTLVALLEKHSKAVNCVKWCGNAGFLASGSDDTLILLWRAKADPHFESPETLWTRASTLRGHEMDVLDLAWSTNDDYLASCSIDNKVLVWSTRSITVMMTPVRVLTGHSNWVKGVAWDPTGRFLASASEDRLVNIWRSQDWGLEAVISAPFKDVSAQTLFLRLSWSPDGSFLGLPNAIKAQQHIAAIVATDAWEDVCADLFGHCSPITVVRFSPVLHASRVDNSPRSHCVSVVAVGSQDATISVWASCAQRPALVMRDCFNGAVSDISWSDDGDVMVVCSHDGSVLILDFDGTEIGTMRARTTVDAMLRDYPGQSRLSGMSGSANNMSSSSSGCHSHLLGHSHSLSRKAADACDPPYGRRRIPSFAPEREPEFEPVHNQSLSVHSSAITTKHTSSYEVQHCSKDSPRDEVAVSKELLGLSSLPTRKSRKVLIYTLTCPRSLSSFPGSTVETYVITVRHASVSSSSGCNSESMFAILVVTRNGNLLWNRNIEGEATAITGSQRHCIVALANGIIEVYDLCFGSLASPRVIVSESVSSLM
mmetsp:Transcript_10165/g.30783  ORF Transcript_10165/g.30783 Transcript_10165/m.30783 type:complete len:621 (-) Transcript_10165:1580-3442(-)